MIDQKVTDETSSKISLQKKCVQHINEKSLLLKIIGKKKLSKLAFHCLQSIGTAFAMYDDDGKQVAEFSLPKWAATVKKQVSHTVPQQAIEKSMRLKKPATSSSNNGLQCYAVPILIKGGCVGGIYFLYINKISREVNKEMSKWILPQTVINAAKKQL